MSRSKGFVSERKGKTKHKPQKCLCGCGELTKLRTYKKKDGQGYTYWAGSWIKGHSKRGVNGYLKKTYYKPRKCACGCGEQTNKFRGRYNKFIKGHENIGRTSWNKGKQFSKASRKKMSTARLGKEPANKIDIDEKKVYNLYVEQKKTSSEVAEILGVTTKVIKDRVRNNGWSRTTKESCNLPSFKSKMRKNAIKNLSEYRTGKLTSIEKRLYKYLEEMNLNYIPQHPLLEEFFVDAFLPEYNLVIEAQGNYWHNLSHTKRRDALRREKLEKNGYKILELWEEEINTNKKDCINKIFSHIE